MQLVRPMLMHGVWGLGADAHRQSGEGSAVALQHDAYVHVGDQPEASASAMASRRDCLRASVSRRLCPDCLQGRIMYTRVQGFGCTGMHCTVCGRSRGLRKSMAGIIEV